MARTAPICFDAAPAAASVTRSKATPPCSPPKPFWLACPLGMVQNGEPSSATPSLSPMMSCKRPSSLQTPSNAARNFRRISADRSVAASVPAPSIGRYDTCCVLSATRVPNSSNASTWTIDVRLPARSVRASMNNFSPRGLAMRWMLMSAWTNGLIGPACDPAMSRNTPSTPKSR